MKLLIIGSLLLSMNAFAQKTKTAVVPVVKDTPQPSQALPKCKHDIVNGFSGFPCMANGIKLTEQPQ